MCAGCNNQRGNKMFHESPVFPGAKPKWFTKAWQKNADSIKPAKKKRPNGSRGFDKDGIPYGRPAKETPNIPMPVPPGPGGRN